MKKLMDANVNLRYLLSNHPEFSEKARKTIAEGSYGWLMKMLSHDIAGRRFLEIIEKFLKAGIMENGEFLDSERGTRQGNREPVRYLQMYICIMYWITGLI